MVKRVAILKNKERLRPEERKALKRFCKENPVVNEVYNIFLSSYDYYYFF